MLAFVLMLAAFICFLLAAWSKVSTNVNLTAVGLALMTASFAVQLYPG